MAVDFATLVCLPCFQQFARPVTITPIASQLGAAPYVVRGDRSRSPRSWARPRMWCAATGLRAVSISLSPLLVYPAAARFALAANALQ
jgi:hypothetical protein